jgi:hypothetical protein
MGNMKKPAFSFVIAALIAGCNGSCGGERASAPPPSPVPEPVPSGPSYEVHEWGLVRGTLDDRVMLSGPPAAQVSVPVAKPVLYFHRTGEGPLTIEVAVDVPRGRIVEHWPLVDPAPESSIAWRGVRVEPGTCRGARYPRGAGSGPPCVNVADGCEASELATVETDDGDCLRTTDGASWNNLFYRGEIQGAPSLPLRLETLPDGQSRVTNTGTVAIPGQLLRLHHDGTGGADRALVVAPPGPGASIVLDAPSGAVSDAASALSASLRTAGLTEAEARAFRRAWDATLFGPSVTAAAAAAAEAPIATATPAAGAFAVPEPWTSVVYVVPESTADGLATLRFSPAPSAVRRAIVAWIDEARAP